MYKHARKQRKDVIVIEKSDRETLIMYSPLTTIMKNAKNKDTNDETEIEIEDNSKEIDTFRRKFKEYNDEDDDFDDFD